MAVGQKQDIALPIGSVFRPWFAAQWDDPSKELAPFFKFLIHRMSRMWKKRYRPGPGSCSYSQKATFQSRSKLHWTLCAGRGIWYSKIPLNLSPLLVRMVKFSARSRLISKNLVLRGPNHMVPSSEFPIKFSMNRESRSLSLTTLSWSLILTTSNTSSPFSHI